MRAALEMLESFFGLIEGESTVDDRLQAGCRDGASYVQQPAQVTDVDVAEAGTTPLELEEVDARVLARP